MCLLIDRETSHSRAARSVRHHTQNIVTVREAALSLLSLLISSAPCYVNFKQPDLRIRPSLAARPLPVTPAGRAQNDVTCRKGARPAGDTLCSSGVARALRARSSPLSSAARWLSDARKRAASAGVPRRQTNAESAGRTVAREASDVLRGSGFRR